MFNLSKKQYCDAVRCPKMLWLKNNKPEVFDEAAVDQSLLENGKKIRDLAKSYFGEYAEVPYDGDGSKMICKTKEFIDGGTPVIAKASFSYNGLFCSVDILKKSDAGYEIYEVKSSTTVYEQHSTEVKKCYKDDAAYQYYVLSKCGIQICRVCIVYVNKKYNFSSADGLDLKQFFNFEDITDEVRQKMPEVEANIERFREYMDQNEEPADAIGEHCKKPHECGCWQYCTRHLPKPNVFDITGRGREFPLSTKIKYYRQGTISFEDLSKCPDVTQKQMLQIEHQLKDLPPHVEKENIQDFLNELSYPLYFLDFEAFPPAIPQYDNSKPYEKITFQYSLHSIEAEGGELKHTEFLAYPGADPRRAVAEQLCRDIPENVCVLAYHASFEKGRIKELSNLYPDLATHLLNIHGNIKDLEVPFQDKHYYTRAMQGLTSIKVVLPALFPNDPELDYHNLEGVHNGLDASATFAAMAEMSQEELERSRQQLLKYCGLDTLAMVKIWQKLKEAVANP